tara:strand:- start:227 stop:763 length:537 start_codon:yes stop_codon:yes gene_type:complete
MQGINKIKMIISDVDGVWTDGSVYKGFSATENIELKKFSVSDGYAVALIREAGLKVALISGRKSAATEARASELKIKDVYNGTLNKIPPYEELKSKYALSDKEIAYVGDDLIDIPIMEKVAFPIATNNASAPCKKVATYVTKKNGGDGAFREAVEWILLEQGRLDSVIKSLQEKVKNQ